MIYMDLYMPRREVSGMEGAVSGKGRGPLFPAIGIRVLIENI
jgi:hypothetical protein